MMKTIFGALAAALALALMLYAPPAAAQSGCPLIVTGKVLTAAQWNSCFQAKQDFGTGGAGGISTASQIIAALGYTPANKAGDTVTGTYTFPAASTSGPSIILPPGTAPTSPQNGSLWTTPGGLFVQVNGAPIGPLAPAGAGISLTGDCTGTASGSTIPTTCAPLVHLANAETVTGLKTFSGGVALGYPCISSSTTLALGTLAVCVDTSGGPVTITLPPGTGTNIPPGYPITLKDEAGTFQTNNLTLCPNTGQRLERSTSCTVFSTQGQSLNVIWRAQTVNGVGSNWGLI